MVGLWLSHSLNAGSLADSGRMDAALGWEGLGLDNLVTWNVHRVHWGITNLTMKNVGITAFFLTMSSCDLIRFNCEKCWLHHANSFSRTAIDWFDSFIGLKL